MKRAAPLRPLAQAGDEAVCGGKAAGLARLLGAGLPAPPGVVIEARAFQDQLLRCGLATEAAALAAELPSLSPPELQARSTALQTALRCTPLAPELAAALRALHGQRRSGSLLAVRSSGIGEDAAAASFAGQFESVLGVATAAALEDAVRQVWASAFGIGALRYGQHRRMPPARMAVIVQEQVDAVLSGVLFTRDPSPTASDDLLVEYASGLGDRLVAGELTPARLRIARDGLRIDVEDAGEEDLVLDATARAALTELARGALMLEGLQARALDIEWSLARDGRLLFLQCRPMTTAAAPAAAQHLWSNANIAENFPGPVVPLLRSFVARGYAGYFRGLGQAFGISRRRMQAMAPALDALVGVHAGRLYYNLSHIHTVLNLAPGGPWLARSFNQFTGAEGAPVPQRVQGGLLERATELLRIAVRVPWHYAGVQRRVARFEAQVDAYAAATRPRALPGATPAQLTQHLRAFIDIRLHRWADAALADTATMVCYGALKALLARWLGDPEHAQLQNNLLQGLPGLASAEPVERLWALAQRARSDPAALAMLQQRPADQVPAALQAPDCAAFRQSLDDYLDRWAFRYSGELMLTQPTPAENPTPVIQLLQTYLAVARPGPAQVTAERAAERLATTQRIARQLTPSPALRRLPLPTRAAVFLRLLAATQGAIRLRERARMKQALLYTRLRHVALALGDRLVAQQALASRDDVFFLSVDEAIAVAEGGPALLPPAIAERRAEFAACEGARPPDQFTLPAGAAWQDTGAGPAAATALAGATLQGVGACGGSFTGPAAVVGDVTQAHRLRPGAVLVTRQTDPGWAAVFFLVKGLVVERGGMLSHGAIIAREYGIPAVVGVREATQILRDGETLRVDGDAGRVERLDA